MDLPIATQAEQIQPKTIKIATRYLGRILSHHIYNCMGEEGFWSVCPKHEFSFLQRCTLPLVLILHPEVVPEGIFVDCQENFCCIQIDTYNASEQTITMSPFLAWTRLQDVRIQSLTKLFQIQSHFIQCYSCCPNIVSLAILRNQALIKNQNSRIQHVVGFPSFLVETTCRDQHEISWRVDQVASRLDPMDFHFKQVVPKLLGILPADNLRITVEMLRQISGVSA